ncbi:EF-hand domain-containing protein [Rhodospirillaceae bacterium SYSU D60014]|uniref:EF-hand domain-containing protein n=1 Tax=Virgifigura deserti TaxID=2268457 RepID=UPI0013C511B9
MLKRLGSARLPLAIATFGLIGLVGTGSLAADRTGTSDTRHGHWGERMLLQMDSDKDGTITRAEIDASAAARAAAIDADQDGTITVEEIDAYREKRRAERMAERLARMDRDGDGKVSVEEFEDAQTWRLARFDRNGDGTIERREMRHGRHGHARHWSKTEPSE